MTIAAALSDAAIRRPVGHAPRVAILGDDCLI
jgi:hypothetical protein